MDSRFTRRSNPQNSIRRYFYSLIYLSALLLVACGGGGSSDISSSATTSAATPPTSQPPVPAPTPTPTPDKTPPSAPSGLSVTPTSPTQAYLTWTASIDNVGVSGYNVYRDGVKAGISSSTNFTNTGLSPATSYTYKVTAYDAAGNVSGFSASVPVTTLSVSANTYYGNPTNYLSLLRNLTAGDTLILEAGDYDTPGDVPGLPIFDLNGAPGQPITITGPNSGSRPVLLGRSTHNTIRLSNASYVTIRNIEVDGRGLGGDGVNSQGVSHHITLDNLYIHGVGADASGPNQQIVGISTNNAPTWNWIIHNTVIDGAGTGMYLGHYLGENPFVAGTIENNVFKNTIGYNIEIKYQNVRVTVTGMPTTKSSTIIRNNVFSKGSNSSSGGMARPNLLVDHFPPSGPGMDDVYEIYGNFFYQNPSEALFQGEGNVAFHDNLLVNDSGDAINIQPHNDVPKMIRVFNNTIVANGRGIRVSGGSTAYQQKVIGNAVFAGTSIQAPDQSDNVTDTYQNAKNYLANPTGALGQIDLFPKVGTLKGTVLDTSSFNSFIDWDLDFNGNHHDGTFRGAYAGEGSNPGWLPKLEVKP